MFQTFWLRKKLTNSKLLKKIRYKFFIGSHVLYFGDTTYTFTNILHILHRDFWKFKGGHGPLTLQGGSTTNDENVLRFNSEKISYLFSNYIIVWIKNNICSGK